MKLKSYQRIKKEDFEANYQKLMDKLGYILNSFNDDVQNAFNKNITIDDNLNEEVKTVDITVDSDGTPTITTTFKNNLSTKVRGLQVIRAENLTNTTTYVTNAPFISFTENSKIITINNVTGLTTNNKFRLTIRSTG